MFNTKFVGTYRKTILSGHPKQKGIEYSSKKSYYQVETQHSRLKTHTKYTEKLRMFCSIETMCYHLL